jgi:hypothetical protein
VRIRAAFGSATSIQLTASATADHRDRSEF